VSAPPAGPGGNTRGDAHVVEARVEDFEDLDVVRCPEWIGDDLGVQRNGGRLPQHVIPERVKSCGLSTLDTLIRRHRFGMLLLGFRVS